MAAQDTGTQPGVRVDRPGTATLRYLKAGALRPRNYTFPPPPGVPWESAGCDLKDVLINDARHADQPPSIDVEGFSLHDAPTRVTDFLDDQQVQSIYYTESQRLAVQVTGGSQAYVFDHLVRRREAGRTTLTFGQRDAQGLASANGRVHNDYTETSGARRLGLVLRDEQFAASVPRYSIVNIWRSIAGPVLDTPLALCDSRCISAKDLVTAEVVYPHRVGEIYMFKHSPSHRWSHFSRMDRHEALVFKQYDSQVSGVSRFTPHTAFDYHGVPDGTPLRQSIELRCLVIYQ